MKLNKTILGLVLIVLLAPFFVFGFDIEDARNMQVQIEAACRKDPRTCSCEIIPCDDLLQAQDSYAQEAYSRCIQEKNACETKRQNAIKEMEAAMKEEKARIEELCRKDLTKCDCSSIEDSEGRKECELAIIGARYQSEKEKTDKIKSCVQDIGACDCSSIENGEGKKECDAKLADAKELKERVEKACRENLAACDCSIIKEEEGEKQCEEKKKEAMEEASIIIKKALSKCFKDVEKCECGKLDLPKESDVEFCEIQKSYGLSCKHDGLNCEKLNEVEIYPPGMPPWLGKFFSKTYSSFVEKEKEKGAKEAAGIISQCLRTPEKCECEKTPSYAKAFCERNKALQIKCEGGDYDACIELDKTPNLPEGIPPFAVGMLDGLVGKLRNLKTSFIQGNAARKVGNMILECMNDASKCDCSLAPSGSIKSFCLHKQKLVGQCREEKIYEACFILDEETIVPIGTPNVIANYINKNVVSQVNEKKQKIFEEMRVNTKCESAQTIKDCKENFYNRFFGVEKNDPERN